MSLRRPLFMCLNGGGFMAEAVALRSFLDPDLPLVYSMPRVERKVLRERFPDGCFFVVANLSRGRRYGLRRNPLFWACCVRRFIRKLKMHKPQFGVFIGGVDCMPAILAARLIGISVIFIESISRTTQLSLTGKTVYHFRLFDRYFVQWPHLAERYRRAEYKGMLQPNRQYRDSKGRDHGATEEDHDRIILVTVGSTFFDEMIKAVDEYFISNPTNCEILYQIGSGHYVPRSGKAFRFSSSFEEYVLAARLIITHGGALTVMEAIWSGTPVIAVPNRSVGGDHQAIFLKSVCSTFNINVAWSVDEIQATIASFSDRTTWISVDNLAPEINRVISEDCGHGKYRHEHRC